MVRLSMLCTSMLHVYGAEATCGRGVLLDHPCCATAGSTDDTEAIVAKTMDGVPGQLLRSKFVDFAQVRRVVMLHGPRLMIRWQLCHVCAGFWFQLVLIPRSDG